MNNLKGSTAFTRFFAGVAGFALWLAAWQWITTAGPLAGISGVPTMTAAVGESIRLVSDTRFWQAIGETLVMALSGLAIALVIGIVLGIVTAIWQSANEALDPLVQFLRPIPAVVILPLVLLIFGPTRDLGIFLAAYGAIWPILVQVQVGIRDVDPIAIDTARAMTLPWSRIQTAVVLPSAAPYIMTGVRIGATAALLLSIGAGLLGGSPGLGRLILIAQEAAQSDRAFGLILWSGVIGIIFAFALNIVERAVLRGRRPLEEMA
ncbi:ABC transporter permease subunit [Agrobacterium tumefaciens]|uniref:ABC transporter permease n=1 Tax=Agrobacterium tumefaciens TaxID=358 RepID=UPI0012B965D0|nr:ABC transporter permease subunit [Agrobacterium tumefaciens]MQB07949.1 ABC transporter permease subunit [Agrobacterium tumefaciens]